MVVHTRYLQAGGEDLVFESEVELLRREGWDVRTLTGRNRRPATPMDRIQLGAETVWSPRWYARLRALVSEVRPDVVHFHNTFPLMSPAVLWAAGRSEAAVVQTLHNYRLVCPSALAFRSGRPCTDCFGRSLTWPGMVHGCYRDSHLETAGVAAMLGVHRAARTWQTQVDAFIALTAFARTQLLASRLDPARVFVKPNFIHPDPGPGTSGRDYCLYVGRLSPTKGVRTLLAAWRSLPDIPLTIAGAGELSGEVRAAIHSGDLPSVRWLGRVGRNDVLELTRRARLCLVPSESYENLPMAILEAFACGTPVVASRLGAMAEVIHQGRTGWLFTPGVAHELAAVVRRAWGDPATTASMGEAARASYEGHYTAKHNYDLLMHVYGAAISRKRGAMMQLPRPGLSPQEP